MPHHSDKQVLSLDLGNVRVGVAIASEVAKLPRPLTTLPNDNNLISNLHKIINEENVTKLVIGRPLNMSGEESNQTKHIQDQGAKLAKQLGIGVYWVDETLSSERAKEILEARRGPYSKGDVDSLAASLILEDYFNSGHIKSS